MNKRLKLIMLAATILCTVFSASGQTPAQKLQKRLFPCVILICAAILMVVIDVCALKISTITMMQPASSHCSVFRWRFGP